MNYKDIYNKIENETNNFTDNSGVIVVSSKSELAAAYDILSKVYSDVKKDGLDYANKDDDGVKYKIQYNQNTTLGESLMDNMNVKEAIEKHDTLNPALWNDDNTLKQEVKEKLEFIVDKYNDNLKDAGINIEIMDIVIIGSNASYNYNPTSDIDLHIIYNPDSIIFEDES